MAGEDIVISIGGDDKNFRNTWNKIQKDVRSTGIGGLGKQFDAAGSSAKRFDAFVKNIPAGLSKTAGETMVASKAAKEFNGSVKTSTQSISSLNKGMGELNTIAPSVRYALYDVANTFTAISAATLGAATAAVTIAAKYETAFTEIERTTLATGPMLDSLKLQFLELARTIPLAFKDLTAIGALGAQMGIADGDLAGFTKTVAQFAATTNVSIQSSAEAFGTLGNLLDITPDKYANLGSAILYVGYNSAATETQILSVTTAISAIAKQAGLSEDYIIGLSGALASLKVPAEQSRGALTRTFQEINRAAATGTNLDNFAKVLGVTTEEAKNLASTDMETFFNKFLTGLSGMDTQQLTLALDALSLSDIRVTNTLTRLSQDLALTGENINNATYAFANSGIIAEVYGKKLDDIASKFQILQNSVMEFAAQFGAAMTPVVGPVLDALTAIVQRLSDALSTDMGKSLSLVTGLLAGFIGVVAAITGSIATTTAAVAALSFATNTLGLSLEKVGFRGFLAGLLGMKTGADGAAVSMTRASIAGMRFATMLKFTGIGLAIAAVATLDQAMRQASDSTDIAFQTYVSNTSGLAAAIQADSIALADAYAANNQAVIDSSYTFQSANQDNKESLDSAAQAALDVNAAFGGVAPEADKAASSLDGLTYALGDNTLAWLRNQLIANEEFKKLFMDNDFADVILGSAIDMSKALAIAATGTEQDVMNYFMSQITATSRGGAAAIDTWTYVLEAIRSVIVAIPIVGPMLDGLIPKTLIGKLRETSNMIEGTASQMQLVAGTAEDGTEANNDFAGSLDEVGDSAGKATKKLRTLLDYASDLSSVWSRALDIRFSGIQTLDSVTKSFRSIAESTADAAEEIQSLNADIQGLTADKSLQEYFLSVAEAYGDSLKAAEIRANIAKIDSDLTKKNSQLQKAQNKTNKTLVGSSDAAIENRSSIIDLVSGYQDHLKALASSGMGQEELRKKSSELKQDFIEQASQLGYNVEELEFYAKAFDDVTYAIDNIPRDITPGLDIDINPALTALAELNAKAGEAGATSANNFNSGLGSGITGGVGGIQDWLDKNPLEIEIGEINMPKWFKDFERFMKIVDETWQDIPRLIEDIFKNFGKLFDLDPNNFWKSVFTGDSLRNFSATFGALPLIGPWITAFANMLGGADWDPQTSESSSPNMGGKRGSSRTGGESPIPKNYYKDITAATKSFNIFEKGINTSWLNIGKTSSTNMTGVKNNVGTNTGLMSGLWNTFTTGTTNKINQNKSPLDVAFEGWNSMFGIKTSSMGSKFNTFAQGVPAKVNQNKSPLDIAFEGWNSIFGAKTSSMSGKFNSFTGAIPGSISAQNRAVGNNSYALGQTSGNNVNSGLSNNLNIPGRVSSNVGAARYPAGVNASSVGSSIGSSISGGISTLLNNLLGYNSTPRRIIRTITGFADGGYTGAGGKYDVAGIVHRGEYVVPKSEVNQSTGMPYFMLQQPKFYSGGNTTGSPRSGVTMVSLSPEDRALLRNIGGSGEVVLYANNEAIARSANMGNRQIVASGGRP